MTQPDSPDRYLDSLARRLTPERMAVVDAVLALEITGEQPGQYTLDCRADGGQGLLSGPPAAHGLQARASARVSSRDFLRIARGELKPHTAVLTGRLRIGGDLAFATRLGKLFAP